MNRSLLRYLAILVCILLVGSLVIGCATTTTPTAGSTPTSSPTEGNATPVPTEPPADPFGKYEPSISVSTVMFGDNIRNVPEGMTIENNPWLSKFKEYGIDVTYKFVATNAEDMTTKINLAIATDDLPDIIPVNSTQYKDLLEADMLADITDAYDRYATDEVKNLLNQDGGLMAENAIVDGRRFGIVLPTQFADYVPVLAYRADWLEEAGLQPPGSMDDIWNMAKTFKNNKMGGTCVIGIGLTKNVLDLLTPSVGLFNALHAYSGIWLEKNGTLAYSSIQPEYRDALGMLANYYAQGLIDPEFGTKDMKAMWEDAISGRSGVVVSHFCAPFDVINGVKLEQEWAYSRMFPTDGQPVKAQNSAAFSGGVVYSAKGMNPEAMIRMYNLYEKFTREDFATYNDNAVLNFAYPIYVGVVDANPKIYREYNEFITTGTKPAKTTQGFDGVLEAAEKYRLNQDIEGGYIMYSIFGPEGTEAAVDYAILNDGYMVSAFTGASTDNMALYGANLKTIEEQMVISIIKGDQPIGSFDTFVADWKANGGDVLTQEVNDWFSKR